MTHPIERIELTTPYLRLGLITLGATVQSLVTPDRDGVWGDIVLGFDDLDAYAGDHPFLGATVGRFANRIAGGTFELDGATYSVPLNDGPHALHGGPDGFGHRLWELVDADATSATLRLVSPDGDMGFPGRLEVTTVFSVDGHTLRQETTAITGAPTVVNLTNHAYFNLHGSPTVPITDHLLRVHADAYVPVDETAIPLPGAPAPVEGTIFDFRAAKTIGADLTEADAAGVGYDHNLVLSSPVEADGLRAVAELVDGSSGRTLTVRSTEPGVQVYSGNFLDGSLTGRGGPLGHRCGVCLETQHFPDSPRRPDYPSTVLRPGETFRTVTEWTVGIE